MAGGKGAGRNRESGSGGSACGLRKDNAGLQATRASLLPDTVDGGKTWTRQLALPYPRLFERDMSFLNESVGFVVVGSLVNGKVVPTLYGTVDGGQRWEARSLPGGGHPMAGLDFVSESRGWVLLGGATGSML